MVAAVALKPDTEIPVGAEQVAAAEVVKVAYVDNELNNALEHMVCT